VRIIVYVPLLVSALLAVAGPWSASRMPPRFATRLLLATGLTAAVTSLVALTLLAATLVGQLPVVAAVGTWSREVLHRDDPVSPVIAALAGAALVALGVLIAWTAARWVRAVRLARRASQGLTGDGRLVVLDRSEPEAFALPAGRDEQGRIVVSSGLLRILDASERRVLLAHETAHLRHRHHRHRALAGLIAAADPLLFTLPGVIHHLTERWADEDAAAAVADRDVTARTLARAALAATAAERRSPFDGVVQCFYRSGVPSRVRALLAGAPPRRPVAALLPAVLLAGSLVSTLEAGHDTAELFDRAGDFYHGEVVRSADDRSADLRRLEAVRGLGG
jgi:hypothetical protein